MAIRPRVRGHRRPLLAAAMVTILIAGGEGVAVEGGSIAAATEPHVESVTGWKAYVAATEARREAESRRADGFLVLDFADTASADRRTLLDGRVVVERMPVPEGRDGPLDVRGAMVHHWRGAVYVPGMTVEALVAALEASPPPQADVLRSRVIGRTPEAMTVFLRLRRTRFITVVYDTEHRVTFVRIAPDRAASSSVATRIVELADPGTPQERPVPAGEDHGFLWRLNAYWRYQAVAGGVIAECESLSLSRTVPFGLGTIARPMIDSTARESMEAALRAVAGLGPPL